MKKISFLPENFIEIKKHFDNGYPAVFPSETSYGFSGNFLSSSAVLAVEKIKNRENKPFLLLVDSLKEGEKWGYLSSVPQELWVESKTTPTTFLVEKTKNVPQGFFPHHENIAIRIPYTFLPLKDFLYFHGTPIFSTSANISGFPPCFTESDVENSFSDIPNLLFVTVGDLPEVKPSRIYLCEDGEFEKIR